MTTNKNTAAWLKREVEPKGVTIYRREGSERETKRDAIGGVHFDSPFELGEVGRLAKDDYRKLVAKENHAQIDGDLEAIWTGELGGRWYGQIGSMENVIETANGWEKGAERALKLSRDLTKDIGDLEPVGIKRTRVWADEGDELDYDRLRAGDTDTMWRGSKRKKRAKVCPAVTIVPNIAASAERNAESMFWSGAVALVLSDLLEDAGYQTAIVAMLATSQASGECGIVSCGVKDFGEPLRSAAVAGLLCHAGVFRTLFFLGQVMLPVNIGWGLGQPRELRDVVISGAGEFEPFAGTEIAEVPICTSAADAKKVLESLLGKVADTQHADAV